MKNLRWWIAGLLFLATVINYIDRQTLSVVAPVLTRELGISSVEYADILTAFLVPYTVMYIFAGLLVDRWGTRKSLAVFMAWWSAANALHALARGALGLGVFRFLLGAGESGSFMAAGKAISEWFPARERAVANGLVNAAAATGAVISAPLIAWVTVRFGWRAAFVLTGLTGYLWLAAWLAFYQLPQRHRWITAEERALILEGPAGEPRERIAYLDLLRLPEVWGLLVSRIFADPVWWFYLFWLPKYLQDVRGFTLAEIGLTAWLPYLTADLGSIGGGWLSGKLVARGMPVLDARRWTMIPFALLMPMGVLVAYLPSAPALAVICLVTFAHMAWKTNLMTMTNDLFPARIVGSAAGLVGLGSGLAGVLSMPLVGRIVEAFGYSGVFWVMGFLHPVAMWIVLAMVRRRALVLPRQRNVRPRDVL
ncbi:MAG: MFS transporter [Acidobacteria bacterium]|nr:MFS transporter [Acidobacteriota bacterium]